MKSRALPRASCSPSVTLFSTVAPREGDDRSAGISFEDMRRIGMRGRAKPLPRWRSICLPAGWRRRWDDSRPIIAGNCVRQLPRREPGTGGPATRVAAEVCHPELRSGRREVERAAVVAAIVTRGHVCPALGTPDPVVASAANGARSSAAAARRRVRLMAIGGPPFQIGKPGYYAEESSTCWNCCAAWFSSAAGSAPALVRTACMGPSSAAYIFCV
jgi:hypothetical protein